jgi:hypothetical protein
MRRVRAEYLEMPGLQLTLEQAQRLCGVERALCQRVLNALVDEKFLCVKADGAYARAVDDSSFLSVASWHIRSSRNAPQ